MKIAHNKIWHLTADICINNVAQLHCMDDAAVNQVNTVQCTQAKRLCVCILSVNPTNVAIQWLRSPNENPVIINPMTLSQSVKNVVQLLFIQSSPSFTKRNVVSITLHNTI